MNTPTEPEWAESLAVFLTFAALGALWALMR